jgi:AraC-like DNA-binding protein
MATKRFLASGVGWRVNDVVCTSGPRDRVFEEQHDGVCIAAVTDGTFQYRSAQGTAVLSPGALLLGNHAQCFECGHEHGIGDRCLSFHFAPEFLETVVSAVPAAHQIAFTVPRLPPLPSLIPIVAAAEAARQDGDVGPFEELALRLAGAVAAALAAGRSARAMITQRDERRISAVLRRIEAQVHEPLSLAALAREAAMSPYHFLRTFRSVVGMTPYQFVLYSRLHRAAVRLRRTADNISDIAFDAGFSDLSTFNRRFRRATGRTPRAYRTAAVRTDRRT